MFIKALSVRVIIKLSLLICSINGGAFEEGKPLLSSHVERDLEDEEVEDLGADEDEEAEEPGDGPDKSDAKVLPSNLDDDITQDEMDFSGANNLKTSCNTSPMR